MKQTDFTIINPVTKRKGKSYLVNGCKYQERFAIIELDGTECVLSSAGRFYVKHTDCSTYTWIELTPSVSNGFKIISVNRNRYRLHKLVADIFIPETKKDIINHRWITVFKDRNKDHVFAENLMQVNQKEMNRITKFEKDTKLSKEFFGSELSCDDVILSDMVIAFLKDEEKYTIPEIINILQLERFDDYKNLLSKLRKEKKKVMS